MSLDLSPALAELFETPQFAMGHDRKAALLLAELESLGRLHAKRSAPYRRVHDMLDVISASSLEDLPYLPVSLFKTHDLRSVPEDEVFKIMTSSGTTGQRTSRVYLDKDTAALQSSALAKVMSRVLGQTRLPMLIVDTPGVIKDRTKFNARGAGLLGMMPFGRRHYYALDDEMRIDLDSLKAFVKAHAGQPFLVFGFTYMVWQYLVRPLQESDTELDLGDGVLIHSGGWKKLTEQAVGNAEFKSAVTATTGLRRIHNFYGMVEQVGSVFLEGNDGFLRPPNFADVIIRDPRTWQAVPNGTPGVVQVVSALPRSYPGHSLLTEDWGVVHGVDDGRDGWAGKRFEILGRIPAAELRGCSDTHAYDRATA